MVNWQDRASADQYHDCIAMGVRSGVQLIGEACIFLTFSADHLFVFTWTQAQSHSYEVVSFFLRTFFKDIPRELR